MTNLTKFQRRVLDAVNSAGSVQERNHCSASVGKILAGAGLVSREKINNHYTLTVTDMGRTFVQIFPRSAKCFSNEDRMRRLREFLAADNIDAFEKQAWEWIKTGTFGRAEFNQVLRMMKAK